MKNKIKLLGFKRNKARQHDTGLKTKGGKALIDKINLKI